MIESKIILGRGSVGIGLSTITFGGEEKPRRALMFESLPTAAKIGEEISLRPGGNPKVYLIVENLESLKVVRDALDRLEGAIKNEEAPLLPRGNGQGSEVKP